MPSNSSFQNTGLIKVYKLSLMPAVNRWQLKLFIIAHKLFKNLSLQPHHPSVCRALCFLHHMNDHVEAQRHLWRVGTIVFVALKK